LKSADAALDADWTKSPANARESPWHASFYRRPTAMLIVLVVLIALAWYVMTPEERGRALRVAVGVIPRLNAAVLPFRSRQDDALERVLRERTPWPVATPLLVAVNLGVYVWTLQAGDAPVAELLGSFAPKTTNGEWWRLVSSTFVHLTALHLVLNLVAFAQAGIVVERLAGSATFLVVYLAAGLLAGLVDVSVAPVSTITGASGAVFGIYGFVVASWMWGTFQHATSTVRLQTIVRLAPVAVAFGAVNLATGDVAAPAEAAGLVTGFGCGVFMGRFVRVSKPPARRVATIVATCAYIALVVAAPLRGVIDVRPALADLLAAEERTAAAYDAAVREFRSGRSQRQVLTEAIDREVIPELLRVQAALVALGRPPREHAALMDAARTFTQMRIESWTIRAAALGRGDARGLREADTAERAAGAVLERVRTGAAGLSATGPM
jgi:rhomboid protease GluP